MRAKVHGQVRCQELMGEPAVERSPSVDGTARAAGLRLLEIYSGLASRGEHLFATLLAGQSPKQWAHYPKEDAIDTDSGFQWFYHSHSPEDRPSSDEHGHIHLFARRKLWARRLQSAPEITFAKLSGAPPASKNTRHLLTISFDAKGVPTHLFTVNSWVTGDRMLSAKLTAKLLKTLVLDTGYPNVDGVIASLVAMWCREIMDLLARRDATLFARKDEGVLCDQRLEILSEIPIHVDAKLEQLE